MSEYGIFSARKAMKGNGAVNLVGSDQFNPVGGTNIRASTEGGGGRPVTNAVLQDGSYWQIGSNNIYGQTPEMESSGVAPGLWIAIDFSDEKYLDEISFAIPASLTAAQGRILKYEIFCSDDGSVWNSLEPATPNNNPTGYNPTENNWELLVSEYASNIDKTISFAGSNSAPFISHTFTGEGDEASKTARYILIYFTLITGSSGTMGMGNLIIMGNDTVLSATIAPTEASYDKDLSSPETIEIAITLNGNVLASVQNNDYILAENTDYTFDTDTGIFIFSETYLQNLSPGQNTFIFNFTPGSARTFTLMVLTASIFADTYLNNPGDGYAIITPQYEGMSLTTGRPAVIDVSRDTDKFPVFVVSNIREGTALSATLLTPEDHLLDIGADESDSSDGIVFVIPDTVALINGTYKINFTLVNSGLPLYDTYYFTAVDNFSEYKSTKNQLNSNNANIANLNPDSVGAAEYPAIRLVSGKLKYTPDYRGNQVMDYSNAGYKGGGVEIPDIPARITVQPLSDDQEDTWDIIQSAIDYVSSLPLQSDGFRGAVYLAEGVFRISKPLVVNVSGIVIRGAGQGTVTEAVGSGTEDDPFDSQIASELPEPGVTKLISTWTLTDDYTPLPDDSNGTGSPYTRAKEATLINFIGDDIVYTSISTTVTDQYVGVGQTMIHVADISGFEVGDTVSVEKSVNESWVRAIYMNIIEGESGWIDDNGNITGFPTRPFLAERTIKAIDTENSIITFSEPLSDNLDMRWGTSNIIKQEEGGRIYNVGVENIQGIAHFYDFTKVPSLRYGVNFLTYNDENHAHVFVSMVNVRDGWLRNFTTYHLDTGFTAGGTSIVFTRNVTIQDGNILDPVSLFNLGERRYSIYYRKIQFGLTKRIYSRYSRHAFIVDSVTSGPNVFYNSVAEHISNASEPHFRWSSGGLYDNISARIYVQNRWNMGTFHGWAGVNYLLYNCTGPFMISQPQITPNYLIGHYFDSEKNLLGNVSNSDSAAKALGVQQFDRRESSFLTSLGVNGGQVPNFPAYTFSIQRKVSEEADEMPESIYIQQLIEKYSSQP